MQIIWQPNPLKTIITLDEGEKRELWLRLKIESLEEMMGSADMDLDDKWRATSGKMNTLEEAVAAARRSLDIRYVYGEAEHDGKTFDTWLSELCETHLESLSGEHHGDCICACSTCFKCRAEDMLGIDTIAGLGKYDAPDIRGAFATVATGLPGRSIDDALETLSQKPKARAAYEWLANYKATKLDGGAQ